MGSIILLPLIIIGLVYYFKKVKPAKDKAAAEKAAEEKEKAEKAAEEKASKERAIEELKAKVESENAENEKNRVYEPMGVPETRNNPRYQAVECSYNWDHICTPTGNIMFCGTKEDYAQLKKNEETGELEVTYSSPPLKIEKAYDAENDCVEIFNMQGDSLDCMQDFVADADPIIVPGKVREEKDRWMFKTVIGYDTEEKKPCMIFSMKQGANKNNLYSDEELAEEPFYVELEDIDAKRRGTPHVITAPLPNHGIYKNGTAYFWGVAPYLKADLGMNECAVYYKDKRIEE